MKAVLLVLALSALGFAACVPGEVTGSVCDLNGKLYFKECAGGNFVARERSCLAEGKACDAGLADCVPAGNCTSDIVETCADGRNVTMAKCNFRMIFLQNSIVYVGVAQPTGESCAGGCAAGFACGLGGSEFEAKASNYAARVALRELDLDGGVRSQVVKTLKQGEGASLYDLQVVFTGLESSILCVNESDFIVKSKKALFNVTWGAVHEAAMLGEGEASGKYCAHYVSGVPCSELDVDFFVALDGISQSVSCVEKEVTAQNATVPLVSNESALPAQNDTLANVTSNATPAAPPYPNFTQPNASVRNITQNATPVAAQEGAKCLGVFMLLLALILACSKREI